MEMGSEALQATKVYRQLLKAVKNHIGKEDHKRHFRDHITQEFQKNRGLPDLSSIQQKLKVAHDYTYLLNSVHHHKVLLSFFPKFLCSVFILVTRSNWKKTWINYQVLLFGSD